MTVKELKQELEKYDDDAEVKVFNDFEESTYEVDRVDEGITAAEGGLPLDSPILIIDDQNFFCQHFDDD